MFQNLIKKKNVIDKNKHYGTHLCKKYVHYILLYIILINFSNDLIEIECNWHDCQL